LLPRHNISPHRCRTDYAFLPFANSPYGAYHAPPNRTVSERALRSMSDAILYNINTAQGLALHLKETGHSLRDICDKLLAKGFNAPRGGRWYPKTVADLMKRDESGVYSGSQRTG